MVYLKKKGMRISFAHVLDGYIADLLIRAVYNANIDNAIADVGTSTRSIGMSVVGNWRTSIDDATGGYARRGMTIDTSNVSVGSVATGRNAPTVDPRWKTRITPLCRSVTAISRNALIAKALAYGVYVLGPEKGLQVLGTLQTVKGVIVDNGGNFLKTPGI
jgi:thiamine biosynthesis lipoprotein